MTKHLRRLSLLAMTVLVLGGLSPLAWADDDDDEIPFSVANVFFELNNTDGDLGIHALIDGDPWKSLEIEMPDGRENLEISVRSRLRRQGLTELFFESAEPTFDELDPEDFFDRFPEGEYEIEGETLDGEEMESEAIVTHLLPAPPEVEVNGLAVPEDCDEDPVPAVSEPIIISWDAVTLSHPDLGRTNEPIDVDRYQVVVEREEGTPLKLTVDLSPDATSLQLPGGLLEEGDELKLEVLVRESSGNQTAIETCFEVD